MIKRLYIDRLKELLNENDIDVAFINPSEILKFLTGIDVLLCERFQGLFVTRKGDAFYVASVLNEPEVRSAVGSEVEIFSYEYDSAYAVGQAFTKYGLTGATVAVNSSTRVMDVIDLMDKYCLKLTDGSHIFNTATVIKDDEAVENLTIAADKADHVYEMVLNYIRPGMTEHDVKRKMGEFFEELGITESYGGSVCFGRNTALPHYIGESAVLKSVDVVLMDYGCKYRGFHSDMTRTFFVGDVSLRQRAVYDIVLGANLTAEAQICPGMKGWEADQIARTYIDSKGYGQHFIHRLGHGIGCCVHEYPTLGPKEECIIENGMTFSIEPGIYIEGEFGVRIEDIVVMKNDSISPLNKADKGLIVV